MKCKNQACLLNENMICISDQVSIEGKFCLGKNLEKPINKAKIETLKVARGREIRRIFGECVRGTKGYGKK